MLDSCYVKCETHMITEVVTDDSVTHVVIEVVRDDSVRLTL